MVKAVTSSYITQENRSQGAKLVYKITYQKSVGTNITIPPSEVIDPPSISNSIGRDFLSLTGGDIQLSLDNRKRQWDDAYSGAYNKAKYDGDLRVLAGFTLADGTNEFVELFSGKIVNIEMSGVTPRNAVLTVRNDVGDKISKTILGKPTNAGTPNPYIYGLIQRARLINLLGPDPNTWTFQYAGTFHHAGLTQPRVYTRRDDLSEFHLVNNASVTFSDASRTIRLNNAAVPDKITQVWYGGIKKFPGGTQPPYLIKDILINHTGIPSTHINATSLQRVRNLNGPPASWGLLSYNTGAMEVIENICHALYSAGFVEGKKFNLVSLGSPPSAGIHLSESDYNGFSFKSDKSKIINQVDIPHLTYPIDLTKIKRSNDITSQASYGTIPLSIYYPGFSFTIMDPLNNDDALTGGNFYQRLANTIVRHNAHPKRIYNLSGVYSKGLRIELGDRLRISNAFFAINQASAVVIGKTVDLNRKRTDLQLLSWP